MEIHTLRSNLLAVPVALAGAAFAFSPLAAQDDVSISLRGGAALPASDLADVTDVGAAVGIDVSWDVLDWMAIGLEGDVDALPGQSGTADLAPDMALWHYGAGVRTDLIPDEASPWSLKVRGGAGATTIDSEEFPIDPDEGVMGEFTETYFSLNGGVNLGYEFAENVALALRGGTFVVFADEEDTQQLTGNTPQAEPFDVALTFPITAEVQIDMPY